MADATSGGADRSAAPGGDPRQYLTLEALQRGWAALTCPTDRGRLLMIVVRGQHHARFTPQRVALTRHGGVDGDAWAREWADTPEAQITLMRADVARLIANGQPLSTFGDNLMVDLDLSQENLPIGTHLRIGAARVRITAKPHRGCAKFARRFGPDALRLTAEPDKDRARIRGVYVQVVEPGDIAVGDVITVERR